MNNPTALDRFLASHKPTCTFWVFSGDRHCSCGRDEAIREVEDLRKKQPAEQPELFQRLETVE